MVSQANIAIIDDERNITLVLQAMLERAGFKVVVFNESAKAIDALDQAIDEDDVQAVITDLYMPGPGGMEILDWCERNHPEVPVVIITAYGSVEAAVAALKKGAFDFVTKPFDQVELLAVVRKAVVTFQSRAKEPIILLQHGDGKDGNQGEKASIESITGKGPEMQEIIKIIGKIAGSPSTVLVCGESGTGKELVAYEIHRNSPRAKKAFIKINCAAIPANLIESEFFGYERGAFTGAVTSKPGRFELAHEGTLFLDEVAEMPLEMQVKLLRVLQEQEFERVGGVNTIKVDVRIIAATNKELDAEVKAGKFREDLFYRLNVVPIQLPPLRSRKGDIDLLVKSFLQRFNEKLKRSVSGIEPLCLDAIRAYSWPGNIRQLENAVERMMLMGDGKVLKAADLPDEIISAVGMRGDGVGGEGSTEPSFKEIVRRQTQSVERDLIEKALEEAGGNVTRTAEKLGLSRKGLQIKIKELGIKKGEGPI